MRTVSIFYFQTIGLILGSAVLLTIQNKVYYTYIPFESWLETARTIERNFPKSTKVMAPFRAPYLHFYLSPKYRLTSAFNREKFLEGRQIVVDSSFTLRDRLKTDFLPAGYKSFQVPQMRGEAQVIYYFTLRKAHHN